MMAEFVINHDMFGAFVKIPTGLSREPFVYKVVCRIESNSYCHVPIMAHSKPEWHQESVPVLKVICCGIDESEVIRVALSDCEPYGKYVTPDEITTLRDQLDHAGLVLDAYKKDMAALKAEVERLRAEKESNRIALLQYASLRKYFKALISATLGDNYYNMGMDVYTCDEMACEEIAEKCGRKALARYEAARAALRRDAE